MSGKLKLQHFSKRKIAISTTYLYEPKTLYCCSCGLSPNLLAISDLLGKLCVDAALTGIFCAIDGSIVAPCCVEVLDYRGEISGSFLGLPTIYWKHIAVCHYRPPRCFIKQQCLMCSNVCCTVRSHPFLPFASYLL